MELSILIPIYNFDVRNLVYELIKQCETIELIFEILLIDDNSKSKYDQVNKELSFLQCVTFRKLDKNIGRSKIRNLLLESSKFSNCLVLDCDIQIDSSEFIYNYIETYDASMVLVGGHKYSEYPPENSKKLLHWKYGTEKEVKSIIQRKRNPYGSFKSNSFLISKEILRVVQFNESLIRYGHEDTMFGIDLELKGIPVLHIDNPIVHIGLETAKDFLRKQKMAIENLIVLSNNSILGHYLKKKSALLRYEESFFLNLYYSSISFYYKKRLYKKLLGDNPKLKTLNFWKFYTLKKLKNLKT